MEGARCRRGGNRRSGPRGPAKKRVLVGSGDGSAVELIEVQIEGRKRMPATAFVNGQHLDEHEILGVIA